ncbi:MAG: hypothetical protein NT177_02920, partial [Chloroflexi bacterium]|nr:hypothetical protein [Chloroflexota bacterium]
MKARIWLIVISCMAVVAVGAWLALWGMDEYTQRQADGRLNFDVSRLPSQDYTVGSFTVRWQAGDGGSLAVYHQSVTDIKAAQGALTISGTISGGSEHVPYTFTFSEHALDNLGFNAVLDDKSINRLFLTYRSDQDEHFFGFGEQFSYFDIKGRRLPIFCQEQGVGRGDQPITTGANLTAGAGGDWHTSYAGVPHYIT